MGRPLALTEKDKERIIEMAGLGLTDVEISGIMGISQQTLNAYKQRDASFLESLKSAKANYDMDILKSLRNRARGVKIKEQKAITINEFGKSRIEIVETEKEIPPDPTSMIFWLKNRQPDRWREKVEHESEQEITVTVKGHKDE